MKSYEKKAAHLAGISLTPERTKSDWCARATEIADFLDAVADAIPLWKIWIRPGLRMAAEIIRRLRDMKCGS